ncbi:MAG: Nitroreductase family protein [Moraxellaceae bacterium]|jgi:nitroreductase|nr:Nitroreductase family protein [Moraxellaceae bacterium]
MDAIDAILTRTSQGKLMAPAPSPEVLQTAFACALRAPDHRVLRPWRYLVIQGEALARLGQVFEAAQRAADPALAEQAAERARKMPLRAPMIVVAITVHRQDPKVPDEELLLSTGAAVQNFMLALRAQGFASMWRTGPLAHDAHVKESLGLAGDESISGFIYVGTAAAEPRKVTPLPVSDHVADWQG